MPTEVSPSLPLRIMSRAFQGAFLMIVGAILVSSCAASEAEVKTARSSGYKTDFATVYSEALAAVAKRYPRSKENPTTGLIQTAWHIVSVQTGSKQSSAPTAGRQAGQRPNTGGIESISRTEASDRKRYFVRFRVQVVGGKPWRVKVVGEASEWAAGDVPLPLRGAEVPAWLAGRTDALVVDIYKRLKKHAIAMKTETKEKIEIAVERPDSFGEIPADASEIVEAVYLALKSRDMDALRSNLAEDVVWSAGSAGSADLAMVMWQADTGLLDRLTELLSKGCSVETNSRIQCSHATSDQNNANVRFEKRDTKWVLAEYLPGG